MFALIIGIATGIATILLVGIFRSLDKRIMYGLILTAIGFLYVGYTWSDPAQLLITILQALAFIFLAYYGITRSINLLAFGYFLHGVWDLLYTAIIDTKLIPPHYDVFCLVVDFIICGYILIFKKRFAPVT